METEIEVREGNVRSHQVHCLLPNGEKQMLPKRSMAAALRSARAFKSSIDAGRHTFPRGTQVYIVAPEGKSRC